jgi:hypothetical protein
MRRLACPDRNSCEHFEHSFHPFGQLKPLQGQQRADHWSLRQMGNKAPETLRASSELDGNSVFCEIDKHLSIISDTAAALIDTKTYPEDRLTDAAPSCGHKITVPIRNERWVSHESRNRSGLQLFIVTSTLLVVLGLGSFDGWSLYRYFSRPDELNGMAAVNALVERIIAVESVGDPNARNGRSTAKGFGQFLDETWLELMRAYRPDLAHGRSDREMLDLRREPILAREMTMRFVERNAAMLMQRGLPVTAGTVYLAHFAGGAGAVAILSAPDNADAALVIASADSTGRTKRERLVRANPFLEHFTVADLKVWADRKIRAPDLRLTELLAGRPSH